MQVLCINVSVLLIDFNKQFVVYLFVSFAYSNILRHFDMSPWNHTLQHDMADNDHSNPQECTSAADFIWIK